jgi:hypothetical protein
MCHQVAGAVSLVFPQSRRVLGPRDSTCKYIRADGRRWEVRVPVGRHGARLSLGHYADRGAARRALRLFVRIMGRVPDPQLARDEMAALIGLRSFLPRWVRRCCRRCRKEPHRHCRCLRRGLVPDRAFIACVQVPGAKAVLGPFDNAANAHRAAKRHLVATLGWRASNYLKGIVARRGTL